VSRHPHLRGQSEYCAEATARWRALDAQMTRPFTAADSVRPERLWGKMHVPSSTTAMPIDAQNFWVGRRWGLDGTTGEWRAFTDEEQARGWMNLPTGFVAVTAVNREAGTFSVRGIP